MIEAVRIERIAAGGDGIGRMADGRTVFVPRTAPGDLVELTGVRTHKRFARARLGRLVEASADRVEPVCPHYTRDECGGCQLQHLNPSAQRAVRRAVVGDALRRIAKLAAADPALEPAASDWGYRAKLTLHRDASGLIGLHPYDRPDRVFDLVECPIVEPNVVALWRAIRDVRRLLPSHVADIVLRLDRTGALHVVLRAGSPEAWGGGPELAAAIRERGHAATIWWQPPGGAARVVSGGGDAYPATVFEQVHPRMGDRVRAVAIERLGPVADRHVWDLYAGIGETSERLAAAGASVESVEADASAVAFAEASARAGNGRPRIVRHRGRVEDVIDGLGRPDLVVTNPPRTGMDAAVVDALNRRRPQRIVYISCDPATLARDLARLTTAFRLVACEAFDLFPQTAHVETVAVLEAA